MAIPDIPLPPPPGDPGMANPFGGGPEAMPPMDPGLPPMSPDTAALLDALVMQRVMEVTGGMGGDPMMGGPPPMGGPPMGPPPMDPGMGAPLPPPGPPLI